MTDRLRRFALRVCAVVFGCLLGLSTAEIVLRFFWPGADGYYLFPPHLSVTFHPDPAIAHGVAPVARLHVNSLGIRAAEWGQDRSREYRILAVGGSTTQCILLDQSKAWPALLEENLGKTADGRRVWVGNLGRAGFNCRDHLGLMRIAISQYDVDAIVLLIGGNDMAARLIEADRYDPHFTEDEPRYLEWLTGRFAVIPLAAGNPDEVFWRKTAVWQLAKWVKSLKMRRHHIEMDNTGKWLAAARQNRQQATFVDKLPRLEPALDEYERLVTGIVKEARRRGLRIVLLTQPALWKRLASKQEEAALWYGYGAAGTDADSVWPQWKSGPTRMYTTAALAAAMEAYNNRLLETCAELSLECVDMAALIPRTLDMFFDDLHYTEAGSHKVAVGLAAYLKTREPFVASNVVNGASHQPQPELHSDPHAPVAVRRQSAND